MSEDFRTTEFTKRLREALEEITPRPGAYCYMPVDPLIYRALPDGNLPMAAKAAMESVRDNIEAHGGEPDGEPEIVVIVVQRAKRRPDA